MKLHYIDKTDREIRNEEFNKRFAQDEVTGAFVLKADALADRFTNELKVNNLHLGLRELREDNALINIATTICSILNIKVPGHQSLEDFITEHKGVLNEDIQIPGMDRREEKDPAVSIHTAIKDVHSCMVDPVDHGVTHHPVEIVSILEAVNA